MVLEEIDIEGYILVGYGITVIEVACTERRPSAVYVCEGDILVNEINAIDVMDLLDVHIEVVVALRKIKAYHRVVARGLYGILSLVAGCQCEGAECEVYQRFIH